MILDQAFAAVRTFQPMNDEQVRSLLAKTAEAASRGEFEPFKTSSILTALPRIRLAWRRATAHSAIDVGVIG